MHRFQRRAVDTCERDETKSTQQSKAVQIDIIQQQYINKNKNKNRYHNTFSRWDEWHLPVPIIYDICLSNIWTKKRYDALIHAENDYGRK